MTSSRCPSLSPAPPTRRQGTAPCCPSPMPPLLTLCCALLVLLAFVALRLHYITDEEPKGSSDLGFPSGTADLRNRKPNSAASAEDAEAFHDEFFVPFLAAYRRVATESHVASSTPRFRSGHIPKVVMYMHQILLILDWYKNHVKDIEEGRCALPCTITSDITQVQEADAVLIHLLSVENPDKLMKDLGVRDPSQPWIMFETESQLLANTLFFNDYKSLNGVFNRTMHYRRDSDIPMVHGFVVRRGEEANLLPPEWLRPSPVHQEPDANRKLAVAFISNCNDNSGRLEYITELKKHAPVDVYGKCGELKCGRTLSSHEGYRIDLEPCMKEAGNTYLFYLAFENALCKDYVTEKLYNLLYYPTVPVVLGAADYSVLLPPHSYINAQDYSPQQLAQRLLYLAQHPQEYQEYLSWRRHYQPSTVGSNRMMCDLCVRLYDRDLYRHQVIEDFYEWFVTKDNCNASGTVRTRG